MEIALGKVNSAASFRDEWVVMAQFSAWIINLQAAARGNPNHRDGRVVQLRAELVESRRHCPANRCQAINIAKDNRGCLKQGGSVPPGHCSGLYGATKKAGSRSCPPLRPGYDSSRAFPCVFTCRKSRPLQSTVAHSPSGCSRSR